MKMKFKTKYQFKFLLVFLLLFFLLTSCTQSGSNEPTQNLNFRKGTEGIIVKIFTENLPTKVSQDEIFPLTVILENKGSADSTGTLAITTAPQISFFSENTKKFKLKGNSLLQQGDFSDPYIFNLKNDLIAPNKVLTLAVSTCYSYETIAVVPVCINPNIDVLSTDAQSCRPSPKIVLSGQGAPLMVGTVENSITQNSEGSYDISLTFEVRNSGKGIVYPKDQCSGNSGVTLKAVSFVTYEYPGVISCSPTEVDLRRNSRIKCTIDDVKIQGAFITPLLINLGYSYSDTELININVQPK